ncbi:DUF6119 family protein [Candidatus Tokpelaia sp.]|uniref:DUF6119 family protein n=1 Tax=Candidatus Tokpelaia sp. TaxID=2233777 RepID=UPI00123BE31D|nr:DUF6119 family protein [Candidatus Tokpelaia sp.]KAA6405157.1 hypothetical protein DPQ22_06315 [Candidatus Tokpelaia sp.]
MPRNSEKIKCNITLLKASCDFNNPADFIKGYVSNNSETIPGYSDILIYTTISEEHPPKWLTDIKTTILPENSPTKFKPSNQSSGLTIFIKVQDNNSTKSPLGYRIFAINYGILGRFHIESTAIQKNFGLYTATKILAEAKAYIKSSQSRVNQGNPINKSIYYSNEEIELTGLTSYMENNEAVSEISIQNITLGDFTRMIGKAAALSIQIKFQTADRPYLNQMATRLKETLDVYYRVNKDDIKALFKDIFPLDEDNDASLIQELNTELIKQILGSKNEFFLFEPENDFDMSEIDKIQIVADTTDDYDDLHLKNYLALRSTPTLDNLKEDSIKLLDGSGDSKKEWSVFRCLYGEIDYNGTNYILSHENWYEVPKDKFERVNRKIKEIEVSIPITPEIQRDSIDKISTYVPKGKEPTPKEHIFNEIYCNSLGGEYFDKSSKQITLYSDKIEVCDIFVPEKGEKKQEFIHCKTNEGASALSHLWNQGLVSAESYVQFKDEYRKAANKHISKPEHHIKEGYQGSIVRYCIINEKQEDRLSFFSKMALEKVVRNLESWGFEVKLSWIKGVYPSPVPKAKNNATKKSPSSQAKTP